jgi:hypothetical protein
LELSYDVLELEWATRLTRSILGLQSNPANALCDPEQKIINCKRTFSWHCRVEDIELLQQATTWDGYSRSGVKLNLRIAIIL